MTATETAVKVLNWAAFGSGPPPTGELNGISALRQRPSVLTDAMAILASHAGARLGWGAPPLGDARRPGLGTALMALALGVSQQHPDVAAALLEAVPNAAAASELALRHGLVSQLLPHLPRTAAPLPEVETAKQDGQSRPAKVLTGEDWLRLSPLTALLDAPPEIMRDELVGLSSRLAESSPGRRWLVAAMAEPVDDIEIRAWRRELLGRLRTAGSEGRDLVMDVYEANAVHYGEQASAQIRWALAKLAERYAVEEDPELNDALSIAAWWRPLWEIRRDYPEALRARIHLGYDYLEGLQLSHYAERMTGRAI